uniref:Putative secreted peptide n=1 Tax=Anopheles braziliensis TaxID=58242 RepID=A0A2M3ZT54_9DIPT
MSGCAARCFFVLISGLDCDLLLSAVIVELSDRSNGKSCRTGSQAPGSWASQRERKIENECEMIVKRTVYVKLCYYVPKRNGVYVVSYL